MDLNFSDRTTKVKYLDKNGYNFDREQANKILVKDAIYEVSYIDMGSSSTLIYLKGITGSFNSVMFEPVEELSLDLDEIVRELALYCHNNNVVYKELLEQLLDEEVCFGYNKQV